MPRQASGKDETSSGKLILRLNMTVPGDRQAITPVVERIMRIVDDLNCADGRQGEIALAIQEALANAVIHGCREDPHRFVQVMVACDEDRGMLIVVRDPGAGFDLSEVPDPVHGENIFRSHGRGIYLINQLMDQVRFDKGGSEVWMWKK